MAVRGGREGAPFGRRSPARRAAGHGGSVPPFQMTTTGHAAPICSLPCTMGINATSTRWQGINRCRGGSARLAPHQRRRGMREAAAVRYTARELGYESRSMRSAVGLGSNRVALQRGRVRCCHRRRVDVVARRLAADPRLLAPRRVQPGGGGTTVSGQRGTYGP